MEMGVALAAIGAALAVGLAGAGSSMGVSTAGKSATGVISEKPNYLVVCSFYKHFQQHKVFMAS